MSRWYTGRLPSVGNQRDDDSIPLGWERVGESGRQKRGQPTTHPPRTVPKTQKHKYCMRGERDRENGRVASVMLVRRAWRPESGWKKATPPSRYSHVEAQAGSDPCHPPTPPTALSTCHLFFFSPLSLRGACFRGSEAGTGATASRHARHVTRFAMGGGGPGSDNCSIYIGENATTVVFTVGKMPQL